MKKLSIVIPSYNSIKYLSPCVDSVLSQTFEDYEIILVDDGASDGSEKLCDEYAALYPDISVIHQENAGASAARNAGLKAAQGEYVHFIDSDDLLSGKDVYQKLSKQALDGRNEIVFFRRERFVEGVGEIDAVQPEYHIDGLFQGDVLGHVLREKYQMTMTCPVNKIFLRSFLLQNDLFLRVGLEHEEDEWLPRVIACAGTVWFDKGVYYTVRNHPESMSRTVNEEKDTARACSKVIIAATGMSYMEEKQLPEDTMSLTATYYWDYLTDACVSCTRLKDKENRQKVYDELKKYQNFFNSARWLNSKNRKMLAVMFKVLGIRITVKIVGIRYGK
ncbi:MAG: glycosyltransferase [Ruminococcus sp.]|nr:glycosyltransferase [Ruminococcus sp.]